MDAAKFGHFEFMEVTKFSPFLFMGADDLRLLAHFLLKPVNIGVILF